MGKIIRCTDCLYDIDIDTDPFCMVVPHGARYINKQHIPLCPDCRCEQGYDIRAPYYVKLPFKQPELPRLEPPRRPQEEVATECIEILSQIKTQTQTQTQPEEVVSCMSNQTVETV